MSSFLEKLFQEAIAIQFFLFMQLLSLVSESLLMPMYSCHASRSICTPASKNFGTFGINLPNQRNPSWSAQYLPRRGWILRWLNPRGNRRGRRSFGSLQRHPSNYPDVSWTEATKSEDDCESRRRICIASGVSCPWWKAGGRQERWYEQCYYNGDRLVRVTCSKTSTCTNQ